MNERILVSLMPYENVLMIDKMREVVGDAKRELGGFIYTSYNLHMKSRLCMIKLDSIHFFG
jgi:hypothetical protein